MNEDSFSHNDWSLYDRNLLSSMSKLGTLMSPLCQIQIVLNPQLCSLCTLWMILANWVYRNSWDNKISKCRSANFSPCEAWPPTLSPCIVSLRRWEGPYEQFSNEFRHSWHYYLFSFWVGLGINQLEYGLLTLFTCSPYCIAKQSGRVNGGANAWIWSAIFIVFIPFCGPFIQHPQYFKNGWKVQEWSPKWRPNNSSFVRVKLSTSMISTREQIPKHGRFYLNLGQRWSIPFQSS